MEKKKIAIAENWQKIKNFKLHSSIKGLLKEVKADDGVMSKYPIDLVRVEKGLLVVTDGRRLLVIHDENLKIPTGNYYMTSEGILLKTTLEAYPHWMDFIPKDDKDALEMGEPSEIFSRIVKEASKTIMVNIGLYAPFIDKLDSLEPEEISYTVSDEKGCIYIQGALAKTESACFEYVQMACKDQNEKPVDEQ